MITRTFAIITAAFCAAGAAALPTSASAASLIGESVSCQSMSSLFDCSTSSATIGDGAEFELLEGFGFGGSLLADFSEDSLNIRGNPANFSSFSFGGSSPAVVTFDNLSTGFTSALITNAGNQGRLTEADITVNDGSLSIDLNGINFAPGGEGISLGVSNMAPMAAVPEPATWAMMLLGFAFVGGTMRSGRVRSAAISYG